MSNGTLGLLDKLSLADAASNNAEAINLQRLRQDLRSAPYCIHRHVNLAHAYEQLQYPDLAAGAFYKANALFDALRDESDDLHDAVVDQHASRQEAQNHKLSQIEPVIYTGLANTLLSCSCYKSAWRYCQLGLQRFPGAESLLAAAQRVKNAALAVTPNTKPDEWLDQGFVRRELYPWNDIEPDRFSADSLAFLNDQMSRVAPDLEVRATELVDLTSQAEGCKSVVKQLGVFARRDIEPGKQVLEENSILTANNRLIDSLCDACSAEMEDISAAVECDECQTVFCSESCRDAAMHAYHPAVCDRGLEALARDVPPAQAADSLYLLLCIRALAMAITQDVHPLELDQTKYIWGDYQKTQQRGTRRDTLPFSFHVNVIMPFDVLAKLDVDIFAQADRYDVWVFNTLYAKFRGTASARLSGLRGTTARGPEVSAVHPLWCLANHSCDSNVRWEWGGRMRFWARDQRVAWRDGVVRNDAGLRRGQEVLSHYCDVELDVEQRREWAYGALGGDCRCERCMWESTHPVTAQDG